MIQIEMGRKLKWEDTMIMMTSSDVQRHTKKNSNEE